jgi:hypothetical protein
MRTSPRTSGITSAKSSTKHHDHAMQPFSSRSREIEVACRGYALADGRHCLCGLCAFLLAVNQAIPGEQFGDANNLTAER